MARDAAVTASARFVFAVLRLAAASEAPFSITEVSRRLDVSVNKAYRAVVTLEAAGYLRRNPNTGRFDIGPAAERLVYAAFEQFHIRPAMAPYLRQIATSAEATTSLAVRIGWYTVTLAIVEGGSNIVSRTSRLGRATLLDRNAAGLAVLAWLTPADRARYAVFAARRPPPSVEAPTEKMSSQGDRLAEIRSAGFAVAEPSSDQANVIAFPLRDENGMPVGAITIDASGSRATPLDADPLLPEWRAMVEQAEDLLRGDAGRYANPYAHLDPDLIDFHRR
jgi:IclR family pca regulon transcriptional regulator